MSEKLPNFLNRKDDKILFNGEGTFIFYVPERYFNKKIAIINGEYINTFGILQYTIEGKNGKNNGLHHTKFAYSFTTRPNAIEKIKNIKITKNSKTEDYRMLKYKKDDEIISSTKVPQSVEYAEQFFKMFLYADVPTFVPYNQGHKLFKENINNSGYDYGFNMQLFGMFWSEVCRSNADIKKLFRHTNMTDMTAYQLMPIRDIPKHVSPFTSITSENFDDAVVNAVNNKNVAFSPLERLITY